MHKTDGTILYPNLTMTRRMNVTRMRLTHGRVVRAKVLGQEPAYATNRLAERS